MIVRLVATIGVLVAFHASVEGAIITLAGPAITTNTVGQTDWGIQFTALTNSTLVGFDYSNQGLADTVKLRNVTTSTDVWSSSNSVNVLPDFDDTFSVNVALLSGNVYRLLGVAGIDGDNGMFGAFVGFPSSNADISVTSGVFSNTVDSTNWFSFSNISTSTGVAAVPEPASAAFLGLGSLALVVRRLRRRSSVVA